MDPVRQNGRQWRKGRKDVGARFTSHITVTEDFILFSFALSFPSRLSQPNICPHNGTKTPHNPQQARKSGLVPFPHTLNVCVCVYEKRIARLKTQVLCKIDLKICFCFLFSNHITKYTFVIALP